LAAPLLVVLTLLAGACLATQVGVNATLARWSGSPVTAAGISFAVGTVVLAAYTLVARVPLPPLARAAAAPWWVWAGGVLGAFYVATMVLSAPRLGAATTIALVVAAQMVTSVVLDHLGAFGFPTRPVSLGRVGGAALIVIGVVLLRRF
jgi:transporter family-2 protein